MPVHNEEHVIIRSIKSALAIEYPLFEVIIINDGSTDNSLQTIIDAFHLKKIDRVYRHFLRTGPVRAFYYNADMPNLLVIDKNHTGNRIP